MASDDLTWELIKKHNSYLVKRDGLQLSCESCNLMNKHSFKHSGVANSNAVGLDFDEDDSTKVVLSAKKGPKRKPKTAVKEIKLDVKGKTFRKVAKTLRSQVSDAPYRRDLKGAALARWTKMHRASKKKVVVKKEE